MLMNLKKIVNIENIHEYKKNLMTWPCTTWACLYLAYSEIDALIASREILVGQAYVYV